MEAIRRPKDFLTGILFAVIGTAVIVIARDYPFGSARQMGAGFFPIVLALILLAFAAILVVRGFTGDRDPIGAVALRPALYILGSALLFSLLLRPLGLVAAIVAMVLLATQATRTLSLAWGILVALVLAAGSTVLFVYLLGQNLPVLGSWFAG